MKKSKFFFNFFYFLKLDFIKKLNKHWYPAYEFNTTRVEQKSNFQFIVQIASFIVFKFSLPFLFFLSKIFELSLILNKLNFVKKIKDVKLKKKSIPMIIAIGNITVGGVGKTPIVISLINSLKKNNFYPAVISRGYKSMIDNKNLEPKIVSDSSNYILYGDEPCLIFKRTRVPVCVGANRKKSLSVLLKNHPNTNLVLLDDGFQQKNLIPDKKILVFDDRFFGNNHCLPYGPMREKWPTDYEIDFFIFNTSKNKKQQIKEKILFDEDKKIEISTVNPVCWKNLNGEKISLEKMSNMAKKYNLNRSIKLYAAAGIDNPIKFFLTLKKLKIDFNELIFENHDQNFEKNLIYFLKNEIRLILTTEKDAIRIIHTQNPLFKNLWALEINSDLSQTFLKEFIK